MAVLTAADAAPDRAFRQAWSVGVSVGLYGVSFGALSVAAGLTTWQTQALSALMFTGGSQFAFIAALGGSGLSAAGTATAAATLLGLRNAVYGAEMNALLRLPRRWLVPAAHLTIDESTAAALSQDAQGASGATQARRGFWWTGAAVFLCWNVMTLLGALAGNLLGDPRRWGLDGAVVAAFVALLWPRLRDRQTWALAAVAALATVLTVPALPPGLPLLAAAVVAALIASSRRPAGGPPGGQR